MQRMGFRKEDIEEALELVPIQQAGWVLIKPSKAQPVYYHISKSKLLPNINKKAHIIPHDKLGIDAQFARDVLKCKEFDEKGHVLSAIEEWVAGAGEQGSEVKSDAVQRLLEITKFIFNNERDADELLKRLPVVTTTNRWFLDHVGSFLVPRRLKPRCSFGDTMVRALFSFL